MVIERVLGGAALTIRVSVALALWAGSPESVTLKVSATPALLVVGVPVRAPVAELRVIPAGSTPSVSAKL